MKNIVFLFLVMFIFIITCGVMWYLLFLLCRFVLDWRKRLTLRSKKQKQRKKRYEFEGGKWRGKGSEEAISSHGKLVSYEWETIQSVWFHTGHSWFLHLSHCLCSNRCFGSNSVWFHCKNLFFSCKINGLSKRVLTKYDLDHFLTGWLHLTYPSCYHHWSWPLSLWGMHEWMRIWENEHVLICLIMVPCFCVSPLHCVCWAVFFVWFFVQCRCHGWSNS